MKAKILTLLALLFIVPIIISGTADAFVTITDHPDDATVLEGDDATFTVTATGVGTLGYQWQRDDANILGATSAGYTIYDVDFDADDGAQFRCIVSDDDNSTTSNSATLTVQGPARILTHPSDAIVSVGDTATFSVTATGTPPFIYQWFRNGMPINPGDYVDDTDPTTATYTTGPVTDADNGARFSCAVYNIYSSFPYAISNEATLTVGEIPTFIVTQPSDATVSVGETATFSVTATGTPPLHYQWQKLAGYWAVFGWKFGFDIDGATESEYTTPPAMSSDDGAQFRCLVSGDEGDTVSSDAATLTVNVPPTVIWHPLDATVNEGERARFIVTAMGGTPPLEYQWQLDDGSGFIDILGGIYQDYYTPFVDASYDGYRYRCKISDAEGDSVTSNAATLYVVEAPGIDTQPEDQFVKEGYTATFNVLATGTTPLTYQWQKNGSNIVGANSSSYTTGPVSMADDGDLFRCYITNAVGFVYSDEALLNVQNVPTITTHPSGKTITAGQTVTLTVVAEDTGPLNYRWEYDDGSGFTGVVGGTGANSSSYTTDPLDPFDSGTKYRCIVSNTVGSATSNAATVTVIVPPVIVTDPASIARDEGLTATFTVVATGTPTLLYQWQEDGVDIPGATNISYTTAPVSYAADNGKKYRCHVSNDAGDTYSAEATLTVNGVAPTITTHPQNKTVYDGNTATFNVVAAGTLPLSYQWLKNGAVITAGGTGTSYTTPAVIMSDDGAVFRCTVSNAVGTTTSNDATLTVEPIAPTVVTHPSDQTVNSGDSAIFTVVATGTEPLAYQWELDSGTGFAPIGSATSSTYNTGPVNISHNGNRYRCHITNGGGFAYSDPALLTVRVPPAITTQPSNQTVNDGDTATFSVVATGTAPLSYQWRRDGGAGYGDIPGATNSTYTTPPTNRSSDDGAMFMCVVSNDAGTVSSIPATLYVQPVPPTIISHPSNTAVNEGQTATFSVTATGTATLSYRWQYDDGGGFTVVTDGVGKTSATYTTSSTDFNDDNGKRFRCVVTNIHGAATSNEATLTVNRGPFIHEHPVSQTVNAGDTVTFSVDASGTPPLSYQWKRNGADILGANASSYSFGSVSFADNGAQFTCVVTNVVGSATSNPATLTVHAPPSIVLHPSGATVNEGASATFSVVATGSPTLTYQWQRNLADISGATNVTYTTGALTLADNGAKFRCVVSNTYGSATSNEATLTVNRGPFIHEHPVSQTVNAGDTVTFSVDASGTPPLSYQWKRNGADILGANASSYSFGSVSFADNGAQFTCVVTNVVGSATSNPATLTVHAPPSIVAHPSDVMASEGGAATFSVTATGSPDLEYQWQRNSADISGAESSSYTIDPLTLADNGAKFRCVVSNTYGSATSNEATLTVQSGAVATFPFREDFESGGLQNYWATNSSGAGRILVTTANGPAAGIYHLTMDSATGGTYSLNELVLTIDLAGHSGVMLNFYHKEFNDEDHIMPATFIGSNVSDGVAISADGSIWHKVQGLTAVDGIGSDWVNYEVNLDTAIAAAGISYNNTFKIKFQQYGNNSIQTGWWWLNYYSDGFAFDDIALYQGIIDTDEDGLPDDLETATGTDPNDADTDNDGILDGVEDANHNGAVDPGETDPLYDDTDQDGIQDGTEQGYTLSEVGPDTYLGLGGFQPDLDPTTTTDPLNEDTDGDLILDGVEDANRNGAVDPGESDPTAAPAAIPFSDGFESGSLENYWTTHSTGAGRIQVTTVNGPAAGIYHLTMDTSTNGFYSLNEAVLNLDLSPYAGGSSGVTLQFLHKEFNDEDDVMPPTFVGSHFSDGVAISDDGTNWYKVQGLTTADGISLNWMIFEVDLDAAVAAAGITYNNNFKIKFQQYGSYPINWGSGWGYFWYWFSPPSDGFAFDNVEVYLK